MNMHVSLYYAELVLAQLLLWIVYNSSSIILLINLLPSSLIFGMFKLFKESFVILVQSLTFNAASNVLINGLTLKNSQLYHLVIDGCDNVNVQGVKIIAPGNSPNTDGIHIQQSTGVTVMTTGIKTGDDCISIGPGTANLWIENVACGPGHGIR